MLDGGRKYKLKVFNEILLSREIKILQSAPHTPP